MIVVAGMILVLGSSKVMAWFDDYGRLVPRSDVEKAFGSYEIRPDMNYYFSGSDVWPDVIMSVDKAITLNSAGWRKMEATPGFLKKLVSGMKSRPTADKMIRGYAILDNKGRQIGMWFSSFSNANTYVKIESEKTVEIHTPINPSKLELGAI